LRLAEAKNPLGWLVQRAFGCSGYVIKFWHHLQTPHRATGIQTVRLITPRNFGTNEDRANQPMQAFGPNVQAGEVVYYNLGVTNAEMESFQRASLYQAEPTGPG
jgi:hypothetical protein